MPVFKHEATGRMVSLAGDAGDRYRELGWVEFTPVVDAAGDAPSSKWKVAALEAYAEEHGIDLAGASSKAEKLALILEAGEDTDDDADSDEGEAGTVPDAEPAEGEAGDVS